ncbi:mushroom body large-type Kenyon cell-specific protein 1 isoform X3 [Culex pipiens pallens]|uniref:mushroom body large-type Kenyon cell-specific protein 1 isoform X3 n=1 Tax=Culex pipiens pallens TaxID=42434 RepID=UPI0022AA45A1|nr:mushroom body large-type Kenyon cell-specific protein 1 isoform X3 [Culex pipiens pallens]
MKSGLERVAEELMGRRKWKHYQDVLTRQQLNLLDPSPNSATTTTTTTVVDHHHHQHHHPHPQHHEGHDHQLLQAVAGSPQVVGPLTPSMVAAAVAATGNLLHQGGSGGGTGGGGAEKAVATAAIVRNGHYQQQQQDGDFPESKQATNNQQVAAAIAADKLQQQQQHFHPEAAATPGNTTPTHKQQNHFNESDSSSTKICPSSSPPPLAPVNSSSSSSTVAVGTDLLTNNNHHHHPHHPAVSTLQQQLQQGSGGDRRKPRGGGTRLCQQQREAEEEEEDEDDGEAAGATFEGDQPADTKPVVTVTSPIRSSEGQDGRDGEGTELEQGEGVGAKLAGIKRESTENQANSSTPDQSSKLIKQENCNNLLSSKLIINNNNSSSNNNNNIPPSTDPSAVAEDDGTSPSVAAGSPPTVKKSASPPPTPVDWKPQEKCYFCVDGKLLTVNEAGELVPESGPEVRPGAKVIDLDLAQTLQDSDSDSSDSSEQDLREVLRRQGAGSAKSLAALLRGATAGSGGVPPTMASLQSMFAAAALQGIQPGLAQFYNPLWYSQLQQQMSPSGSSATAGTTPTAELAGSPKGESGSAGGGGGGDGPLDLSAKPGTSGLNAAAMMAAMMDPKHYKAKPRLSPIGGRRTYTEDELQNALHDILNGRLGTRRAAVQYGIPRSTLRNKVYKLAMEHKREMLHNMSLAALVDDDDDKDSVEDGDIGKEESYQLKLNQQAFAEAYLRMYAGTPKPEPGSGPSTPPQQQATPEPAATSTPTVKPVQTPQKSVTPQSAAPSAASASNSNLLDPNLLVQLQSLLLAGGISGLTNAAKSPEEANAIQTALSVLPELVNKLVQQQELIEQIKKANEPPRPSASTPTLNNGQPIDPRLLPYLQQQQNKPRTASGTPETTTSSMDLNDGGSDDSQVILKIPSYKPVPGGSPMPATAAALLATSKNGDHHHSLSTPSPPTAPPPTVRDLSSLAAGPSANSNSARSVHTASPHSLHPAAHRDRDQQVPGQPQPPVLNHHHPHHLSSVISPPLGIRPRSNSQSPPSLLGGKSMLSINDVIARSISKNFQQHHQSDLLKQQMEMEQYKRPTISVIKNLGGTDISRFGRDPNITQMTAAQLANTGTGGKGTRPKRGKYRNYDRDSLVEAVKAVQRGEMSVHRAGSYYGVPHSTLEYKVKERHLMRPRKREPKPQPGLDGLKSDLGAGSSVMRNMDKSKNLAMGSGSKGGQMKSQYPGASPNGGLKMPMFDPASMASQLPYGAPFLWPHAAAGFSGLPMDFGRQSAGAAGGAGSSGTNANDSIFASPMMQRFQDPQGSKGSPMNNSGPSGPKTARELAESIYDGTSTNGSLLDDIIRHSLDKKPGEMSHGALFDQLMKNNNLRTTPATAGSSSSATAGSDDPSAAHLAKVGAKRSATSPLNFLPEIIKRERASPGASSTSSTSSSKPPNATASFNDHLPHHQLQLQQQQHQHQQRHLNTSLDGTGTASSASELLAQGNLAVESILKMREDLTSLSAAHHHKRTPMEDQHNGDNNFQQQLQQQQQQQLHHHQQQLSHRLVTKLPTAATDDSS